MDTATGTLARYKMFIGGEWVDAASGETFPSDNPFTGKPWALIPRGSAQDADRAVRAAHKAFTAGDWPKLNASQRGALLRKLGDLIGEKSKFLAEIEVRDNGKLYAEMSAQTAYMAQWYYYYGGLADKIEGRVIPIDKPDMLQLHALRAARRGRRHHAVELAAAADRVEARARARGRQHGGDQALRVHLGLRARIHEAGRAGGLPARRGQRRHRLRRRTSACRWSSIRWSPRSRSPARTRPARSSTRPRRKGLKRVSMELGGKSPNIVFDDAQLENAVKGVGLRHLRRDRPDLHRRLAPAGAAEHPRSSSSTSSSRSRRPRRWATR